MAGPLLRRRDMIGMATALGLASAGEAAVQGGLVGAAQEIAPDLLAAASDALAVHNDAIWSRDVIAIADFGLPSATPRFHLVDILRARTTSLRVTHGRGSDPDHTGMLQAFSDAVGSAATSQGAYLTGPLYTGVHGLSRRLIGMDATNAHAEERAIVIHSAWYADAAVAERQGKLGRSDGCFAVSPADIALVLSMLGEGRLLFAGRSARQGIAVG
jgi:hypothetical protein